MQAWPTRRSPARPMITARRSPPSAKSANRSLRASDMSEQNDESAVLVDIDDGVATIRFNRPKALNALNVDMAKRFRDIVTEVVARDDVRIIVLCGNGRAFVAGGDLAYFRSAGDSAPQAARELIAPMHQAVEQLI